jgi:predicted nucleic-acid-binding Zn-ribbon protein
VEDDLKFKCPEYGESFNFFERLIAIYCQSISKIIYLKKKKKKIVQIHCAQCVDWMWRLLVIFCGAVHLQMMYGGTVLGRLKKFLVKVTTLCISFM